MGQNSLLPSVKDAITELTKTTDESSIHGKVQVLVTLARKAVVSGDAGPRGRLHASKLPTLLSDLASTYPAQFESTVGVWRSLCELWRLKLADTRDTPSRSK